MWNVSAVVPRIACDDEHDAPKLAVLRLVRQMLAQPPHRRDFDRPSVDHPRERALLFC
jgi:hypothetical protein